MTSFFGIKVCIYCIFLENDKMDLRQIFFRILEEKTLIITTCIEKHCTRPLSINW